MSQGDQAEGVVAAGEVFLLLTVIKQLRVGEVQNPLAAEH
jgi:hypothetical protein